MEKLEIKEKFTVISNRVKCVDQHPTEPWLLCALHSGEVTLWNYETKQSKVIKVCELPVRVAKFVPRKNWLVIGSDDLKIRIYNYNTMEEEHAFEAHGDYIRSIVVHPTKPYFLSCSDDQLIKLWNWDSFLCERVFKGHDHYVMQVAFNPKDHSTFASASLDKTVKVWQLDVSEPSFTLHGHNKGVNCVDYLGPYLVSGGDDNDVKIWDYQNKICVRTLQYHTNNVTSVCFISKLSLLLTASEDGAVGFWHTGTYRLQSSVNYGFQRAWTVTDKSGSNQVAIGFDEGAMIVEIENDEPIVSMDSTGGKVICAKDSDIQQINLKNIVNSQKKDGEILATTAKEMGSADFSPKTASHSPSGRFVAMIGQGEFTIYTAVALRNKTFGAAQDFAWAYNNDYGVIDNTGTVKIFGNFVERATFTPEGEARSIHGGRLLGIACKSKAELCFYDWQSLELVSKIEARPRHVFWSDSGEIVCIVVDNACYVLKYDATGMSKIGDIFKSVGEIPESITSGIWIRDCFIYTDALNMLKYFTDGDITPITVLDRPMYIIGYIEEESRIYLTDRDLNIVTHTLPLSVLEYQTAILRNELETAEDLLQKIPEVYRTSIAQFLEKRSLKSLALAAATDPGHQFELALSLGELGIAQIAAENANLATSQEGTLLINSRWTRLGNAASSASEFSVAETCYRKAKDYSALLLLAQSTGDKDLLLDVARLSKDASVSNVAFLAYFLLSSMQDCLEILVNEKKLPEAAFFARSYVPGSTAAVVKIWKDSLTNAKLGRGIADPEQYANLFPELCL